MQAALWHARDVGQPNPLTGRQAPIILGHEFVGEVVEVGKGVTNLRAGDRVAPDVPLSCGHCYWCQRHQVMLCEQIAALGLSGDGGLAEYIKAPAAMCLPVPNGLPFEHAALAEPTRRGDPGGPRGPDWPGRDGRGVRRGDDRPVLPPGRA